MNKKEFIDKLMHLLTEDGLKPQLQKSQKLNYPSQDVIVLTAKSMPPVIYTNFFWQEFLGGTPFQDVYRMVLEAGEEAEVEIKNELKNYILTDWEDMKSHVYYRVYSKSQNEVILQNSDFPHFFFLDLLITFYIQLENECMSIPIHNAFLDVWNITNSDLLDAAVKNTSDNWYCLNGITSVVRELKRNACIEDSDGSPDIQAHEKDHLYVLSNQYKTFGASAILNNAVLENAHKLLGENFFILPCSIHELILLPQSYVEDNDVEFLRGLVESVNASQVCDCDRLSDSVYYYDYEENIVKIVA